MTPITEDKTRYFWFQHRNTDPHDKEVSERMNAGARMAFEEDRVVLEQVHKGMKNPATPYIDLGLDAGAKLFRQMVTRTIDAEQSG
jgi:vanillate O-demethylase monooxygenase subunit